MHSLAVSPAAAHPPAAINITITGSRLNIAVEHNTRDKFKHYIGKIIVWLNGKELVSQKFTLQQTDKSQSAVYALPELKSGAIVKVYAECNMKGSLTAEKKAP